MHPRTRYTKSGNVHLAYQVFGEGPVDFVFVPGFISQIENYWDEPGFARWLHRLGSFARVVLFDKRGTGLSDRLDELPGMDLRMDDVGVVMDAVEMDHAVVMGISEGGSLAALFAAHHPERCQALVLYGAFASFTSWFPTEESLEELFQYIDSDWGSGASIPKFAPSKADDPAFMQWWGKFERLGATPGDAIQIMRMNSQIEITDVLPTIRVPTLVIHRTYDVTIEVEAGRTLAERIPNAKYVELPGADHLPWVGDTDRITQEIEEFITGSKSAPVIDRVLATVLISDIVESTSKAEALGDERWQDLMTAHNTVLRTELERFQGNEVRFTGDGFLITFDGPARAVHCAMAISRSLEPLGIEVRLGLHTGEVELREGEIHGIAVNMAARIGALARASEILVSRTVKDLIAGSGIALTHHGQHDFKGLAEPMDVYLVEG
jgi:class 3 adenylate cyclase